VSLFISSLSSLLVPINPLLTNKRVSVRVFVSLFVSHGLMVRDVRGRERVMKSNGHLIKNRYKCGRNFPFHFLFNGHICICFWGGRCVDRDGSTAHATFDAINTHNSKRDGIERQA